MKIFKFGGASVKNAEAVKNVVQILGSFKGEKIGVVVSAMGKTTNLLEKLVDEYVNDRNPLAVIEESKAFHDQILNELFEDKSHVIFARVETLFGALEKRINTEPSSNYAYEYDQLVGYGELLSTTIVSAYINEKSGACEWLDARKLIRTNVTYKEAKIDWDTTHELVNGAVRNVEAHLFMTQGFLGHTNTGHATTLGREGSDFSAAILAHCLEAESVTIWKDVPGVLNADPKWFDNTQKLNHISFKEAIELSYYGATVIHPKTIQPLKNKNIPLFVKSFVKPEESGTVIHEDTSADSLIPSFIFKMKQVLISISPKDFSFMVEENLSEIFEHFASHRVKINLMQNSAISFSVSVDESPQVQKLIAKLRETYNVKYNDGLELVTIRHYDQETLDRVSTDKKILVEQKSRATARLIMKSIS